MIWGVKMERKLYKKLVGLVAIFSLVLCGCSAKKASFGEFIDKYANSYLAIEKTIAQKYKSYTVEIKQNYSPFYNVKIENDKNDKYIYSYSPDLIYLKVRVKATEVRKDYWAYTDYTVLSAKINNKVVSNKDELLYAYKYQITAQYYDFRLFVEYTNNENDPYLWKISTGIFNNQFVPSSKVSQKENGSYVYIDKNNRETPVVKQHISLNKNYEDYEIYTSPFVLEKTSDEDNDYIEINNNCVMTKRVRSGKFELQDGSTDEYIDSIEFHF